MINKQEIRVVAVLSGIFALRMLGLCLLLPVFALEAMHYKGATAELIGIAVGSYGLAQAILQIPFGWISDKYGRKPLIVVGLSFIMLGSLIGMRASSIYGLIIGRVLQGCGSIGSVVLATLTENVRSEVRARAMAILGATIGLSFALAIVLGPWLNAMVGLSGVFAVIASLAGLCSLLVFALKPVTPAQDIQTISLKTLKASFSLKLAEINIGIFVLHANLASLFLILPSRLQDAGIVGNKVWQFYLWSILAAMLVAWRVLAIGERQQNLPKLQSMAIFCLLFAEVLLYTVNGWFGIASSVVLFFSAFCVLEASLPALVAKYASKHRGVLMGLYSCLQFLGVFVGGVIGGWLHGRINTLAVLYFCITILAGWLLINIFAQKTSNHVLE